MSAWNERHPRYSAALNTTDLGRLLGVNALPPESADNAAVGTALWLVFEILFLVKGLFGNAEKKQLCTVRTGQLLVLEFEIQVTAPDFVAFSSCRAIGHSSLVTLLGLFPSEPGPGTTAQCP